MEKDPTGQNTNKHQSTSPTEIEALRQQVETWRRTRHARTRVPDDLWVKAVIVAKKYGVHKTAQGSGLRYATLKSRMILGIKASSVPRKGKASDGTPKAHPRSVVPTNTAFVELEKAPFLQGTTLATSTTLEIQDSGNRRWMFRFAPGAMVDVAGIVTAFERHRR
jgi:hypothetical protein